MNNEQDKDEKEKDIIDHIGGINTAASGAVGKWIENAELPKGSWVLSSPFWILNATTLGIKIAKAENEREVFDEVYKFVLSAIGSVTGGFAGGKLGATVGNRVASFRGAIVGGIAGAGVGAYYGNKTGEEYANHTSDKAFAKYQDIKSILNSHIQAIQSIGTTNPRLTLADIKLVEALFDQYTQKDSIQSNKQDRISCLQPTISQAPNFTNKNISVSFRSAISSKTTQSPKDETLNLKNQISKDNQ